MPSVALNGVDYTVNVIDQPERFHILEGRTCMAEDEIVITEFIAANFGLGIGDTVTISGVWAVESIPSQGYTPALTTWETISV